MDIKHYCRAIHNNNSVDLLQQINKPDYKKVSAKGLGISTTTIETSSNPYIESLSWGGTKWNWSQGDTTSLTYYFGLKATASNCPAGVTSLNGYEISTGNWTNQEKLSC